ncbi:3-mercaptopyruvate sulfurtransferase [Thalassospiraceae bacterium LMO-SO8]|nr:3-mercaptopyruvate sulfurtransferase [Alphaproteobacteria bacterium LMO-S08]WND75786.1 3-mercaptopyruvate sulfurtransferase [Thalassospiraceae bacterium LMO-SO8]
MPYSNPQALVSTDWVADHMSAPDVRIVDCTYYLPNDGRNGREEYAKQHLDGAVFFDIDDVKDPDNPLPHMIPPAHVFSAKVRKLGLGDGIRIVCYDHNGGGMAAARVWWMFRLFGHGDVCVMDGGLPKWLAENRPVTDIEPTPRERHFTPRENHMMVRTVDQVLANIDGKREDVLDVRAAGRFAGTSPEPRAGMRSGHMPGALNLPYGDLMDADKNCTMRSAEEIRALADKAGVNLKRPLVTSCGSGVTACYAALALYLIGKEDVAVYDGSWSEWGARQDTPIVT